MIKTHTCWNKHSRRGDWWCVIAQLSSCSLTVEPVNMILKPANASATYMHWIFLNSNAYMQYDGGKKIIIIWVFVFKNNAGCWLLLSRLLAPRRFDIPSFTVLGAAVCLQSFSLSLPLSVCVSGEKYLHSEPSLCIVSMLFSLCPYTDLFMVTR